VSGGLEGMHDTAIGNETRARIFDMNGASTSWGVSPIRMQLGPFEETRMMHFFHHGVVQSKCEAGYVFL